MSFMAMFHMSGDSPLFRRAVRLESEGWLLNGNIFEQARERHLPLYEAKMVHQFNHRFGDYADKRSDDEGTTLPDVPEERLTNPDYAVQPRDWIDEAEIEERLRARWSRGWLMGWRDICRSTDERTVIASIVPRSAVGDKLLLLMPGDPADGALLCGILNSFALDYCARQKLGGSSLKYFTMRQLPVLTRSSFDRPAVWDQRVSTRAWIEARVIELAYTAWDVWPFANDLACQGPPFRWDSERRFHLRCELDAAFFHLYRIARDDVEYIMSTFPIVNRNDQRHCGEYRTEREVLAIYDQMQRAIETRNPYRTGLDPTAADPSCRHPKKKIGVLAFGSLIGDPGDELEAKIAMRIKTKTPFGVEYGRYSGKTRGGAPTLVPHEAGAPVAAEILVLDDDLAATEATDMLWRRETRRTGPDATYVEGTSANSVLVRSIVDNPWVETLLYTDFLPAGKIPSPTAAELADRAIRSVAIAETGKDGITYLSDALKYGVATPLTSAYRDEILRLTNADSLEQALSTVKDPAPRQQQAATHD